MAMAFIVLVETGLWWIYQLSPTRYGGESSNWRHVKQIEENRIDQSSPIVILGDSTAGRLEDRLGGAGVVNLSLKVWDTMVGQYFILKKYLESGARPKVCVFLVTDYFWEEDMKTKTDLEKANGSLFRPFGSWSNVFDLAFRAKRPDLAKQMLFEGILPSKRLKGPISDWLERLGLFELKVQAATGWETTIQGGTTAERIARQLRKGPIQLSPLSMHYFNEIHQLCRRNDIQLLVLESSISASKMNSEIFYQDYSASLGLFLQKYGVPYQARRFVFSDESFGEDGVHLKTDFARQQFADAVLREIKTFLKSGLKQNL